MNTNDLVALNWKKQQLLTKENEKIYGDILIYVRMSNLSEEATESVLLELLDHLLEAQENGKKAEEVFGKDPKAFCDDLIATLPKMNLKENIKMFVPVVFMAALMWLLISGSHGKLEYSLISIIGAPLNGLIYVGVILYGLRLSSFHSKKKSFAIGYVFILMAMLSTMALVVLDHFFGKPFVTITGTPFYIIMVLAAIILIVIDYKSWGIRGVLFASLLIASQWVPQLSFMGKGEKLIVGLILNIIAFIVLFKLLPREEKKTKVR
ncbi:HAAS domain-containing protein [Microbacteriaceae bacterium 4G12]